MVVVVSNWSVGAIDNKVGESIGCGRQEGAVVVFEGMAEEIFEFDASVLM